MKCAQRRKRLKPQRFLDYARNDKGGRNARDDKEGWSLEMTGREKCLVERSQKKVLTFNKLYHDKERNRKIHRSADCLDSIGDTDSTGRHIVHGRVKKAKRTSIKNVLALFFIT
jgi:hypothetical protein